LHQLIRSGPWVIVAMACRNYRGKWLARCWICKGATPHSIPYVLGGLHHTPEAAVEAACICGQMVIAGQPVEPLAGEGRHPASLNLSPAAVGPGAATI